MKSICLLLLFAVFFVQCSTNKYTVEEKALIEKYQMPDFSSDEINRFALDYVHYFEKITQAAKSGDESKIKDLQSQVAKWAMKASDMTQKMTNEDAMKWVEWSQKIANAAVGE